MFALVDCNNFYASCERIFNPQMRHRPVVVLSNNDGCIVARSQEVKALGIKTGTPLFKVRDLVAKNQVAVFSSNYTLYGDMSHRVMTALNTLSSLVEPYSIDEAFMDLSHLRDEQLEAYAQQIRQRAYQWTGIPVSVGVAQTKTLAKIASRLAKKAQPNTGYYVLRLGPHLDQILEELDVSDVWGIGKRIARKLHLQGIRSARAFRDAPDGWVKKQFAVTGLRVKKELEGFSCLSIEDVGEQTRKAVCTTRSFGKLLKDQHLIREAVSWYAVRCGEKLRKQHLAASFLHLYLITNRHKPDLPQHNPSLTIALPHATNSSIELVKHAADALSRIYKPGFAYKKAGVFLTGLVPDTQIQTGLFEEVTPPKHQKLMKTVDQLNGKMGRNTIRFAAQGTDKTERLWFMKKDLLSPCYSTQWSDLMEVH